jgi:MFS family permease
LFTWLPTFLKTERHLTVFSTGAYLGVIIVGFGLGCLTSGYLMDRLGRRRTVVVFTLFCMAAITSYLILPIDDGLMLYLGFPLGFFAAGIPAAMGTLFSELFPEGIRGTGVGFCYNFGRLIAAICPALIGGLGDWMPLSSATGLVTLAAYSLVLIALACLPTSATTSLKTELNPA